MTQWRLVIEGRRPSRLNMERDSSLFRSVIEGRHQGILRIYNWDEPAVTIGFHQDSFCPAEPEHSIPILRRPTGGGAVLHLDDLTFSISTAETGLFSGIVKACRNVSRVFALALRKCGVEVEMKGDSTAFSDVCFMRSSPVELCLNGTKVMGLALLRRNGHILQQGVLPLRIDTNLSRKVFGLDRTPDMKGLYYYAPGFDINEFIEGLQDAFSSEMNISLSQGRDDDDQ